MTEDPFQSGMTGTVEVDETWIGGKPRARSDQEPQAGPGAFSAAKAKVVTLVERDGRARSFPAANLTAETLQGALRRHVAPRLHGDDRRVQELQRGCARTTTTRPSPTATGSTCAATSRSTRWRATSRRSSAA